MPLRIDLHPSQPGEKVRPICPDGIARALHKQPEAHSHYIRVRPCQAPMATCWMCRTINQDGLGVACPATSGVEGHAAEKAIGWVVGLPGGVTWQIDISLGHLTTAETDAAIQTIDASRGI